MRSCKPIFLRDLEAPRPGLEPGTSCLEGRCSIQLSYRGLRRVVGLFFPFHHLIRSPLLYPAELQGQSIF